MIHYFEAQGHHQEQLNEMAIISIYLYDKEHNEVIGGKATGQMFLHQDKKHDGQSYFIIIFSGHQINNLENITRDYHVIIEKPAIFLDPNNHSQTGRIELKRRDIGLKHLYRYNGIYFNDIAVIAIPFDSREGKLVASLYNPQSLDDTSKISDQAPTDKDTVQLTCWTYKDGRPIIGTATYESKYDVLGGGGLKVPYKPFLSDYGSCGCSRYNPMLGKYQGVLNGNYNPAIAPAGADVILATTFSQTETVVDGLPIVIEQAISDVLGKDSFFS